MEGEIGRIENKLTKGVSGKELAVFFSIMDKFRENLEG